MSITSVWFYVLLMPVFVLEAWLLSFVMPFHRSQEKTEAGQQRVTPVDGLRGVLAVSVFFLHVTEFYALETTGKWLTPGSNFYEQLGILPVSMFFFITGYVFWLKLLRTPKVPLGPFLYGRLGRLGGVYGFACVLCFGLIAWESGFHRNVSVVTLVAQVVGWLAFFGSGHDMNAVANSRLWLGPAWTLRFEWLFYLSVPFLGWFAVQRRRLALLVCGAALMGLAFAHLPVAGGAKKLVADQLVPYFDFVAYTFSVGMLVASVKFAPKWKAWAQSAVATIVSLCLVLVTLVWAKPEMGWVESLLLLLPFACICNGNTWFGLLSSRPIRFLGRISYSFYLLHVVLLAIELTILNRFVPAGSLSPMVFLGFAGLSGCMTVLISAVSYEYLEHPLLHVGRPRRPSAVVVASPAEAVNPTVGSAA